MGRDDDVVQLMVRDELIGRMDQLHPHDHGQQAADHPCHDREQQVKGADVLVIGRAEPADEEPRRVAVAMHVMTVRVGSIATALISHFSLPRSQLPAGAGWAASVATEAAATRTASPPSSLWTNFFLASTSQCWKSSFDHDSI